ncbi:hypothetical protein OTSANNIE_0010 [Anaplasma phagocytophilum str. Annie]|nr:hypothetical protein OTSANNIE_0010 [Anaplasma phagocytophilum str. Annie]
MSISENQDKFTTEHATRILHLLLHKSNITMILTVIIVAKVV